MTKFYALLLIALYVFCNIPCAYTHGTIEDLLRLRGKLFENYTTDIRPAYNLSDTVAVTLDMILISILDLNAVTGTITLNCGLFTLWTDYRLSWDPNDFGGITTFVLNSLNVWKPRIYVVTSSDDLSDFSFDDYDVRVYSNGQVSSSPGRHMKVTCIFDMTYFPSDSQTCVFQLTPMLYTMEEVILIPKSPVIDKFYCHTNGEWDLCWTSVKNNTDYGNLTSTLDFSVHLKRHSAFFILPLAAPMLLLLFLNPFVFLLPASSGERTSYSITISLSLTVYMTVVSEQMPKISDPISKISYFFLLAMLYSGVVILLTILTLRCHDVANINSFPNWVLWLIKRVKRSTSCRREKIASLEQVSDSGDANDATTADGKDEMNEKQKIHLSKDEVTGFIDKFLFCVTLFYTTLTSLVFTFSYWH
ncbi:acetylcholine receptor subunit alpha-like [Argopecten irradians]|uniref:acetylcholine receptor subunit alpha-like n=1 Tax=Argopecten irradians TaxID=31199 RepID=UPI00371DAA6B